jgi:hypothetical protein
LQLEEELLIEVMHHQNLVDLDYHLVLMVLVFQLELLVHHLQEFLVEDLLSNLLLVGECIKEVEELEEEVVLVQNI